MTRFNFCGTFETGSKDLVLRILRRWRGHQEIDGRIGRIGFEITHDESGFYLYCYEANTDKDVDPFFLLEGDISGDSEKNVEQLRSLLRICKDSSVGFSLEYCLVGDDDLPIGDEKALTDD